MSKRYFFPEGFYWGSASASYQVEGNIYNTDWAYEARTSEKVPVADEGPDHYNRFEEDFDIAQSLGHNAHRISIEWARIEPSEGEFNAEEIQHYAKVLRALKDRGMEPFVTLWHFTLPEWLYKKGGVEHKKFPDYFARYCAYVTKQLGDLCDHWATINEPNVLASNGWLRGNWPPLKVGRPFLMLKVINNLAKAHIAAYEAIKHHDLVSEVSIVKDNIYFHSDRNPINKLITWYMGWFWNRRYLNKIKDHMDSIGLNYYFHSYHHFGKKYDEHERSDMGWELFPEGIYHTLMELKRYDVPLFVAEAGIADEKDIYRAQYIKDLVYWTHRAIDHGAPVKGFMYWSIMDNFEWALGYGKRFGLIEIDYETKERRVRDSALVYKEICTSNSVLH